jgi:iron complex transport system ATP-binding protein
MLKLKEIEYFYKSANGEKSFTLGPINLEIKKGEKVSILGPNGSGKSTLLKIAAGIYKPVKGKIYLGDVPYSDFAVKELAKQIAFVPQNTVTIYPFTIYEMVMMGRTPYLNYFGYENNTDCEIVEQALESVDILHLKEKAITQVSGGEIQRAFIARALAQQSGLVLLDEPNSHLDIKHQIELFDLIERLSSEKKITFISVSHDLNLAARYFNRSILIKEGKVAFDGKTEDVVNSESIRSVFGVNSKVYTDSDTNKLNISYLN